IDRTETHADQTEEGRVGRVAREVEPPVANPDDEAAPQGTIAIERRSRREVVRRRQRHGNRSGRRLLPPIERFHPPDPGGPDQRFVPERRDDERIEPPCETPKRWHIEMIVVTVA